MIIFSLGVYVFVRVQLFRQLNQELDIHFSAIALVFQEDPNEAFEKESEHSAEVYQLIQGGRIFFQSLPYKKSGLPEIVNTPGGDYRTVRVRAGRRYRMKTGLLKNGFVLTVARGEEDVWGILRTFSMILLLILPSALILTALGGYVLASRILKPVSAIARKVERISAESLSERLPVENPADEFGKLATVFNLTLSRLENAFERLQRFTADASHELRTPVAAIQSVGEVALQESLDLDGYRDRIGNMLEETARLTHLIDSLLLLTRADHEQTPLNREKTDPVPMIKKAVDDLRIMAEEKGQRIVSRLHSRARIDIDEGILRRAVMNILDNAIKYTPPGGTISVSSRDARDGLKVEVTDTGPGIAPEHRDKIFDRFYRVGTDRSREMGGAGLGLAIAKWAVEVNGGRLELESSENQGSTFRMAFPA